VAVSVAEHAPFDAPARSVAEAEKRADFALDDRLPRSLDEPLVRREDKLDRPRVEGYQESVVTPKKRAEIDQG